MRVSHRQLINSKIPLRQMAEGDFFMPEMIIRLKKLFCYKEDLNKLKYKNNLEKLGKFYSF